MYQANDPSESILLPGVPLCIVPDINQPADPETDSGYIGGGTSVRGQLLPSGWLKIYDQYIEAYLPVWADLTSGNTQRVRTAQAASSSSSPRNPPVTDDRSRSGRANPGTLSGKTRVHSADFHGRSTALKQSSAPDHDIDDSHRVKDIGGVRYRHHTSHTEQPIDVSPLFRPPLARRGSGRPGQDDNAQSSSGSAKTARHSDARADSAKRRATLTAASAISPTVHPPAAVAAVVDLTATIPMIPERAAEAASGSAGPLRAKGSRATGDREEWELQERYWDTRHTRWIDRPARTDDVRQRQVTDSSDKSSGKSGRGRRFDGQWSRDNPPDWGADSSQGSKGKDAGSRLILLLGALRRAFIRAEATKADEVCPEAGIHTRDGVNGDSVLLLYLVYFGRFWLDPSDVRLWNGLLSTIC